MVSSIVIAQQSQIARATDADPKPAATPEDTAESAETPAPTLNAFELAAIHGFQQVAVQHFRVGRFESSEAVLRQVVEKYPQAAVPHYLLASLLARLGKSADALASLSAAVANCFRGVEILERDPYLAGLREASEFAELLSNMRENAATAPDTDPSPTEIAPALAKDGVALVGLDNTVWDPRIGALRTFFRFAEDKPVSDIVAAGDDPAAARLNDWYARGLAAGNHGDLYDNRDGDHSNLAPASLPQLAYVEYADTARVARAHHGINANHFFNAITFGNSSTAIVGTAFWRSQGRLALTDGNVPRSLFRHYATNHVYLYPEHRDHDPKHGDVFPANTPYVVMSLGSSGLDKPFLRAVGSILAAFRPEVKAFLRTANLIAPTVQMILRLDQESVVDDHAYLRGRAHPSVFDAGEIDLARMIEIANALTIDTIPPVVLLSVVEESQLVPGVDSFGPHTERLFDTSAAIARVVRSTAYRKRLVVRATASKLPPDLASTLTFHWVVLRGDAERIEITPRNAAATEVEIVVPWHARRTVPGQPELTTDRVDIGVFVSNGSHTLAPSFISLRYSAWQKRDYDAARRIIRVDYRAPEFASRYADPILFVCRNWTDRYDYDTDGNLLGWQRSGPDRDDRFTRHGAKVVETDAQGRPARAQKVTYLPVQTRQGWRELIEVPVEQFLTYDYADESDRLGTLRP